MPNSRPSEKKAAATFGLILALALFGSGCRKTPGPVNLIYISLDTTRHDFINTGRGARANTPELKRFASQAVVMDNAFATIPQTLPSHLSIFTSRFPHELGVLANENEYDGRYRMIQEVLKDRGYHTAGVISLGSVSGKTGISRGFDEYREDLFSTSAFFVDGRDISRAGQDLLKKTGEKPFFLFVHYSDPHSPYSPPDKMSDFNIRLNNEPIATFNAYTGTILRLKIALASGSHTLSFSNQKSAGDFRMFVIRYLKFSDNCTVTLSNLEYSKDHYNGSHLMKGAEAQAVIRCRGQGFVNIFQVIPILTKDAAVTCYSREVEYLDQQVGKFLATLEKRGLMDNTIVAIFADHGEGLGERDGYFGHVRYLNPQFIHVPLMMRIPGIRPKHIRQPVSLIGLTPTVLNYMGIRTREIRQSENWRPLIEKRRPKWNRTVFSYAFKPSAATDKLSVIRWPFQAIFNPPSHIGPVREFYNLNISQSFSRFDQIDKKVMISSSNRHYRLLSNDIKTHKDIFLKKYPPVMANASHLEKLRMLGYIN